MTIQSLVCNLKALEFDELVHGKGMFKVNKKLFSCRAINNDKALEYICLFLFRKIDSVRVKKDLLPILASHTRASKSNFITRVYHWLNEIRESTTLLKGVPLRKSVFETCHGDNLIKIMTAFSAYVLENYSQHTDAEKGSALPKAASASHDQSTAVRRASSPISFEPPRALEESSTLMPAEQPRTVEETPSSAIPEYPQATSEATDTVPAEQPRIVEETQSSAISEYPQATSEATDTVPAEQPRTVEETQSSAIPEYPQATSEATNTVPAEYPPAAEESPSPAIQDYPNTMSAPSSLLYADQSRSMQEPASSIYAEEPNAVATLPDTNAIDNIYMPNGSRMITTPNYIPRPLTPELFHHSNTLWDYTPSSSYLLHPISQVNNYYSPEADAEFALPLSPRRKRSFEEDDEDSVVVPRSPPRQRRRIMDKDAMSPTSHHLSLVPPLMDEPAPVRRMYNNEYFDPEFMTFRR